MVCSILCTSHMYYGSYQCLMSSLPVFEGNPFGIFLPKFSLLNLGLTNSKTEKQQSINWPHLLEEGSTALLINDTLI